MLKGPHIVLADLVTVPPETVGTLFPEKDPSALRHSAQPIAADLVRLSELELFQIGLVDHPRVESV